MNIINHFSKFVDSYLLTNKIGKTVLNHIKNFINDYGLPDQFGFDNCKEFSNNALNNFLTDNNNKIIKGKSFHPR